MSWRETSKWEILRFHDPSMHNPFTQSAKRSFSYHEFQDRVLPLRAVARADLLFLDTFLIISCDMTAGRMVQNVTVVQDYFNVKSFSVTMQMTGSSDKKRIIRPAWKELMIRSRHFLFPAPKVPSTTATRSPEFLRGLCTQVFPEPRDKRLARTKPTKPPLQVNRPDWHPLPVIVLFLRPRHRQKKTLPLTIVQIGQR